MEIRVQSVKFDADVKLLEFIDKKVGKLSKFLDNIIKAEVILTLEPDHHKHVKVLVSVPGEDLVVERVAGSFEDAVNECSDVLKEMLVKVKEKRFGR